MLIHIHICRMNIQKFIVPEYWYKLLVWCENGALQAEYIFTKHEDKKEVSINIIIPNMLCSTFSQKLMFGYLLKYQLLMG